jgi:transcriptional regulator with XRE-family HTH domain
METIGSKISKIRKQKGMSQEELSDLSKINLRTLQRIEKDENQPSGNTLRLICETLQINIEEIIPMDIDMSPVFRYFNVVLYPLTFLFAIKLI